MQLSDGGERARRRRLVCECCTMAVLRAGAQCLEQARAVDDMPPVEVRVRAVSKGMRYLVFKAAAASGRRFKTGLQDKHDD